MWYPRQENRSGKASRRSEEALKPWLFRMLRRLPVIYASLGEYGSSHELARKRPTRSDYNRASCCGRASIFSAPIRDSRILCAALAYPDEICVICAVTETDAVCGHSSFSQLGKRASHSAFSLRSSRPESPLAMLQRFSALTGKMIHGAVRFLCERSKSGECRRAMSIIGDRAAV